LENKYWPLSSRANKSFKTSGSDDTGVNTYTYNELGYRGDSSTKNIDIMSIGCSHTEGIGVNDNETWPSFVAKTLNMTHINMGFTGRYNDYISRIVSDNIQKFKPKILLVMYTYPSRREYWTKYGPQPFATNPWGYFEDYPDKHKALTELQSKESDYNNFLLNHKIITSSVESSEFMLEHFIWNGTFTGYDYKDSKRFDGDYNIEYGKHATADQNKKYASDIVGYLQNSSYI
jgi:hypothetical protein